MRDLEKSEIWLVLLRLQDFRYKYKCKNKVREYELGMLDDHHMTRMTDKLIIFIHWVHFFCYWKCCKYLVFSALSWSSNDDMIIIIWQGIWRCIPPFPPPHYSAWNAWFFVQRNKSSKVENTGGDCGRIFIGKLLP